MVMGRDRRHRRRAVDGRRRWPRITVHADMSTEGKPLAIARMLGHIDRSTTREGGAAVATLPIGYSLPCRPLSPIARGPAATDNEEEGRAIAFADTTIVPRRVWCWRCGRTPTIQPT